MLSTFGSARFSATRGLNTRNSTYTTVSPMTTSTADDSRMTYIPVGEFELGMQWGQEATKALAGMLDFVRISAVFQIYGGASAISAANPSGLVFADRNLYLVGGLVQASY
jgi:hypothetical protein